LLMKRSTLFQPQARGVAVRMSPTHRAGPALPPLNGVIPTTMAVLQNLPSICVGHALDPQPNDIILDMCAAPGGKTSHLASLTNNQAVIIAADKSRSKMKKARLLFQEMGCTSITPLVVDTTNCVDPTCATSIQQLLKQAQPGKDKFLNITKFAPESFDRILLDPPCSALGQRPRLVLQEPDHDYHPQKQFLKQAVALLKPGGTMTYSTCTTTRVENEDMVDYVLTTFSCMKLVPISIPLGKPGLEGYSYNRDFVKRFDPDDALDTIGFFLAKFTKQ
jgi:16S rRNA C967 or C1407 C5-methylase (RsmB/RsmF family)